MKLRFRVKELMEEKQINSKDLAQTLDLSLNTVKAYKNNWIQRPDLDVITKFCEFFGVPVAELLVDIDDPSFKGEKAHDEDHDPE